MIIYANNCFYARKVMPCITNVVVGQHCKQIYGIYKLKYFQFYNSQKAPLQVSHSL